MWWLWKCWLAAATFPCCCKLCTRSAAAPGGFSPTEPRVLHARSGRHCTGAKILNRLIKMLEADRTSHIQELHHPTDFWLSLSYYHLAICQQQQQESGTVEVDVLDNSANKARMESPCPSLHQSFRRVENAEAGHLKTVRNLLSQICQEWTEYEMLCIGPNHYGGIIYI